MIGRRREMQSEIVESSTNTFHWMGLQHLKCVLRGGVEGLNKGVAQIFLKVEHTKGRMQDRARRSRNSYTLFVKRACDRSSSIR